MARLYHYKGDSQQHFLLGSVNGSNTTIQCGPLANRIFQEIGHEPGIRGTRRGPQLPGELVYGMWENGLLFTGDGEQGSSQSEELTEDGESPQLADTDRDALRELLSGYSGPLRGKLEALAATLGISTETKQAGQGNRNSFDSSNSGESSSSGTASVSDKMLQNRLKEAGVIESFPVAAFREWYTEKSTGPSLDSIISSPEIIRAVSFLVLQEDVSVVSIDVAENSDEVTEVTGLFSKPGTFDTGAEISLSRFYTSDGFLPDEEDMSGLWEKDFLTAWWYVYSTIYPKSGDTAKSISCETTIDLTSSGVTSVHTDAWNESGHFREEYAIRRHQIELTEQVLERHIQSSGPFSLPEMIDFSQYPSTVDFYEESINERIYD